MGQASSVQECQRVSFHGTFLGMIIHRLPKGLKGPFAPVLSSTSVESSMFGPSIRSEVPRIHHGQTGFLQEIHFYGHTNLSKPDSIGAPRSSAGLVGCMDQLKSVRDAIIPPYTTDPQGQDHHCVPQHKNDAQDGFDGLLATKVPLIHTDQPDLLGDVNHSYTAWSTNSDGPTITSNNSFLSRCSEKIRAGCTDLLNAVRDVAIPPCSSLFSQRHPIRVHRHDDPIVFKRHHVPALTPLRDSLSVFRQFPAPNRQQKPMQTSVSWHTGFCYKGDCIQAFPVPQQRTTISGAVPVSTSIDDETLANHINAFSGQDGSYRSVASSQNIGDQRFLPHRMIMRRCHQTS